MSNSLPQKDVRYYKGKYKVEILLKGKRKGKHGPITYGVKALELIPELNYTDKNFVFMFTTIPRLLWRNPR